MIISPQLFRPPPLKIGQIQIDPPLILAPMAGVTDGAFRKVVADHGAGMVFSEMISVEGLRRQMPATWKLIQQEPSLPVPLAVQIFGAEPEAAAEAARRLEDRGAPLIDINAGCPVRKVVRQGAGAALLRDPERLVRVVEAVRKAVRVPVTVKVRLGWDSHSIQIVEISGRLVSAGVDAISVHGRTAVQQYSGQADWAWIGRIKAAVSVPVIGNGDVTSVASAQALLLETGCDGVMIGRGAMGNPWLFEALAHHWRDGDRPDYDPSWEDYRRTVHGHVEHFLQGLPRPTGHLRKLLAWYSKGCPEGARLRSQLMEVREVKDMLACFDHWLEAVAAGGTSMLPFKVRHDEPLGHVAEEKGGCVTI
jgi:tRNA-dihydrouridine synthase B